MVISYLVVEVVVEEIPADYYIECSEELTVDWSPSDSAADWMAPETYNKQLKLHNH